MSSQTRAWLQIHFCVLLWGFTAILGKLITLDALGLVFWRLVFVSGALLLVPRVWRALMQFGARAIFTFAGIGVLLSLHWVTFYASVKLSNASVAATCMALTPVALALLDPLIGWRRVERREVLFGLLVVPAVVLVVGATPVALQAGIAMGAVSALAIALVNSLNKRFTARASALGVTFVEMAAGVLFLPLLALWVAPDRPWYAWPGPEDLLWLVVLACACTLLPYVLYLVALRQISAFSAALAVNLEPLYTIGLAVVIFHEQRELGYGFYGGAAILVGLVFAHAWLAQQKASALLASAPGAASAASAATAPTATSRHTS